MWQVIKINHLFHTVRPDWILYVINLLGKHLKVRSSSTFSLAFLFGVRSHNAFDPIVQFVWVVWVLQERNRLCAMHPLGRGGPLQSNGTNARAQLCNSHMTCNWCSCFSWQSLTVVINQELEGVCYLFSSPLCWLWDRALWGHNTMFQSEGKLLRLL